MRRLIDLLSLVSTILIGCTQVDNDRVVVSFTDHDVVNIKGKAFPLKTAQDGFTIRCAYPNTSEFMLSNIQCASFRNIYYLKDYSSDDIQMPTIKYADFSIVTSKGEKIPIVYFGRASNITDNTCKSEIEINIDVDLRHDIPYEIPETNFYLQLWCNMNTTQGKDLLTVIESFSPQVLARQCTGVYIMPY